jgi:hypothetical protein
MKAFVAALQAAGFECHETEEDVMRVFVAGDVHTAGDDQQRLCAVAQQARVQVRHLRPSLPTLEDVFARAVGES